MPIANAGLRSQFTVVASVFVLASAALPASAGARAPIVYVQQSGAAASPKVSQPAGPTGKVDKATQRIEFRYPGSTVEPVRVETASVSVPKRAEPVAETTYTEAPQFAPRTTTFDASSTAAQIAASRGPLVEATPLQPVAGPKPVQLVAPAKPGLVETGLAIVYGDEFAGLPTANGEIFDQSALTAAHPSLPLPSLVQVSNPATGREVTVRVNDRGPFEDGASLQVSRQVAVALGFEGAGQARLTVRLVDPNAAATPKPRSEYQPVAFGAAAKPAPSDELLGGDELAGGTGWTSQPANSTSSRAAVQWPEPPAEWGVRPAGTKISAGLSGSHYVQLASFSDIGNAETMYRGLRADLPVEIVPARVNGTDYFRVRVGPLANRESALELRDRLNAEGKGDGRVVTAE